VFRPYLLVSELGLVARGVGTRMLMVIAAVHTLKALNERLVRHSITQRVPE
jgi:hypothetical protein